MDLKQFDLNLLIALEALLEEQSVTGAARRVGRSQPAMSHALARLRSVVGDPLFVTSGRRLVPTPRALDLYEKLPAVLDTLRELLEPPEFDPATSEIGFRISIPDAAVALVLADFLARVANQAPGISITVSSVAAGRYDALESGDIDLAIDTFLDAPDMFHRQSLMESHLVAVVRSDHPCVGDVFDMAAFSAWPHIWIDTATSRVLDVQLERQGIERHCSVRINSFFTGAMVAAKTDGILVLPRPVAELACGLASLTIVPIPVSVPRLTLDQLWHPRRQFDGAHVWLRGMLVEAAQGPKAQLETGGGKFTK